MSYAVYIGHSPLPGCPDRYMSKKRIVMFYMRGASGEFLRADYVAAVAANEYIKGSRTFWSG